MTIAGQWPAYPVAHICRIFVPSHDFLYRVAQDIPYTLARRPLARRLKSRVVGERLGRGGR